MERVVEYWVPIAIIVGTFLGAILTPMLGYFRKPKRDSGATLHGAAMVDSGVGNDIAIALNRIAEVGEKIEQHMKETADSEAEDRKIRAAVEAARTKWEQEHNRD